jgi:hypothetical protein
VFCLKTHTIFNPSGFLIIMTTVPEKRVYKSSLPYMKMIADDGAPIIFIRHTFITDSQKLINYLEAQIAAGITDVYIDPEESVYNPDVHDPIAALRFKIREELLAELREKDQIVHKDHGIVPTSPLKPGSTTDIAPVTAGGLSGSIAALKSK